MPRPALKHPTELELAILKVLWRDGPLTVRQVRDALAVLPAGARRDLAHTSVLTMMTIMVRKRYLRRRRDGHSHVYEARVARDQTDPCHLLPLDTP